MRAYVRKRASQGKHANARGPDRQSNFRLFGLRIIECGRNISDDESRACIKNAKNNTVQNLNENKLIILNSEQY